MGEVYTFIAIFKTSLVEKKRLIKWLEDSKEYMDLKTGIGDWCKWKYESDKEIKRLSEEFPLIIFVFISFGENYNNYRYVTVHNGIFTSFDFKPLDEEQKMLDEIISQLDEEENIDLGGCNHENYEERKENDNKCDFCTKRYNELEERIEDLTNKIEELRRCVLQKRIKSMYLDDLTDIFCGDEPVIIEMESEDENR